MVYIAYFTELNLQICDYAQNDAFVAKIANTHLTKIFMAIFAPYERLPSSATLITWNVFSIKMTLICYGRASWLDLLLDKCSNCTIIVASTGLANCCLWTQIHSLALEDCIRTHKTRFQLILPVHSQNVTKNLYSMTTLKFGSFCSELTVLVETLS